MMRALVLAALLAAPAFADTAFDAEVLAELNFARTNPREFTEILRDFRSSFNNRGSFRSLGTGRVFASREGVAAVDEAIAFMEDQPPLPPLTFSPLLATAAADHTAEQGPRGDHGHRGSRGTMPGDRVQARGGGRYVGETISYGPGSPLDVVIQLIVDDGVPDRGHRKLVFDGRFSHAGASCGPHRGYQMMCTVNYAISPDGK